VGKVQAGDLALLQPENGKPAILRLDPGQDYQTHKGIIYFDDLVGIAWGSQVSTHLGAEFTILQPSLRDLLLHIRRKSQILFPKDIGYILLRLSVCPGKRILEIGTGSGAFTTALAWMVGVDGKVVTYDRRSDMQELALENLSRLGLEQQVELVQGDVENGLGHGEFDAAFVDVPAPDTLLRQIGEALNRGAVLGVILPTTNQVDRLLESAPGAGFGFPEVTEILIRNYKTTPGRLRPYDRMIGHTGYLVFLRYLAQNKGS
jgi:tRNA (adenine57-N1/adenine58-N1)-methyltransferase